MKSEAIKQSVLDALDKFEDAYFHQRNLERTLQLIHPECTGFGTGRNEDVTAAGSFVSLFERDFRTQPGPVRQQRRNASVQLLADDIGLVNTSFDLEIRTESGEICSYLTRASYVFRKHDDRWLLHHFHASEPSMFQGEDEAYAFHTLEERNRDLEYQVSERTKALTKTLAQKDVLMNEVHHRVRNNMAALKAILSLQAEQSNPQAAVCLQDAIQRLRSMMSLYDMLFQTKKYDDISIASYLHTLVTGLSMSICRNDSLHFSVNVQDAPLPVDTVFLLGIIANELLTNACKHAYPADMPGTVWLDFRIKPDGGWRLEIKDRGIPLPGQPSERTSFGMSLVEALSSQLEAVLSIVQADGVKTFRIEKSEATGLQQ